MGCCTTLDVSSQWRLDEIVQVMEAYLPLQDLTVVKKRFNPATGRKKSFKEMKKVIIRSCDETSPGMFTLHFRLENSEFEEQRTMFVHHNSDTPLGPCTSLSLGANDESIRIMRAIARVLGGYLEENDCEGDGEMIIGAAHNRGDSLLYFVTSGFINGKLDINDKSCHVEELQTYIKEWKDKYERRR